MRANRRETGTSQSSVRRIVLPVCVVLVAACTLVLTQAGLSAPPVVPDAPIAGNTTGFLSECGALTQAVTYFEQGANTLANGNLKSNGTANNVQVRLLNNDLTAIDVSKASTLQNSKPVAISSGALPDSPNCQIAPPPASTDISQRKSILIPLRSAWLAKWIAITGARAIESPQFR